MKLLLCVTGDSPLLKEQLSNPHLRQLLTKLNSAWEPGREVGKLMKEPLFAEFVAECLSVVEPEGPEGRGGGGEK